MMVDIPWELSFYGFYCLSEEVVSDNREEEVIGLRVEEKCEEVV